jgi:site-specific recombinase XerD
MAPPDFRARRIGRHHFAHLRAVAEGLPVQDAAQRYLGIEHGLQAVTAHRAVVEHLRALARRRGERAARLIGLVIRLEQPTSLPRPTLEAFRAARDLDDWSETEVLALYAEAYPPDRRQLQRLRLRERQIALLHSLEQVAAETPQPSDPLAAWIEPGLAERLRRAGLLLLGELQQRITPGGRWWRAIPGVGVTKAHRLEAYLAQLLPPPPARAVVVAPPELAHAGSQGRNRALPRPGGTQANTDAQAIDAWVRARAGSAATARTYRREAERLQLWCLTERHLPLSSMTMDDCLAYLAFLEHLPPHWISRRRAAPHTPGWAPFTGQLSAASRRQAVIIVGALFTWLVAAGYLQSNPWVLVNRRIGDDPQRDALATRAFTPLAWVAITGYLDTQPASPACERMRFVLAFGEAVGLRASELIGATLGDLTEREGRLLLQVTGKGARRRVLAVPGQASQALERYLHSRGLPALGQAAAALPLLASVLDAHAPVGYRALYASLKSWVLRAVRASSLTEHQCREAEQASLHWLRHTCGTRAVERGVPLDVVQQQFGHRDPRTTSRYTRAQLERVAGAMEQAFGGALAP